MITLVLCFGILISRPTICVVSSEIFMPVFPRMPCLCCPRLWAAHNRPASNFQNNLWVRIGKRCNIIGYMTMVFATLTLTLRRGQSANTLRVADAPKTDTRELSCWTPDLCSSVQASYSMASLYMSCFLLPSCLICINLFSSPSPQFILLLI